VEIDCKGLDVLFDAWQRLCAERVGPRPLLLLVGSGRDDEKVRRRISTTAPGTVQWHSRYVLDRELLWRYLSAADVAALPSRREGFPVTVIEAMACALPVVASDVSGVREALGDDPPGIIVPPGQPDALAEALRRLVDDPALRYDLGVRARRRAEQEFSLAAVGSSLRTFMEQRGAFRRAHV